MIDKTVETGVRVKPTLIHVDPTDWVMFQDLCGKRGVSKKIRAMVKRELRKAGRA